MLQACRQAQHKTFIDEAEHQSSSSFIIKNERFMIKLKLLINQREDIYKIRMQLFFFSTFHVSFRVFCRINSNFSSFLVSTTLSTAPSHASSKYMNNGDFDRSDQIRSPCLCCVHRATSNQPKNSSSGNFLSYGGLVATTTWPWPWCSWSRRRSPGGGARRARRRWPGSPPRGRGGGGRPPGRSRTRRRRAPWGPGTPAAGGSSSAPRTASPPRPRTPRSTPSAPPPPRRRRRRAAPPARSPPPPPPPPSSSAPGSTPSSSKIKSSLPRTDFSRKKRMIFRNLRGDGSIDRGWGDSYTSTAIENSRAADFVLFWFGLVCSELQSCSLCSIVAVFIWIHVCIFLTIPSY